MSVEDDEKTLNQIAIQAQLLQRQGQSLQQQIEMMQTTVNDLQATIDSLDNLSKAKDLGLLPIGSGVYITCKQVDTDAVLLSVGSGLIVNKKATDAADTLRKRQKSVMEALDKANASMANINQQMQDLNARASVLAARMEDVRPAQG
ncbi:Prefoldin subunit alpha [uncultured archaeon]|nr:Prefoldin subunit alpha [uncultured archaeon]